MYLTFDHVNFAYATNELLILRDISFSVERDEIMAILGESGCGKSTLLRLISGFEMPLAGSIYLNGRCLAHGSKHFVPAEHRGIGMVFQDYALFPHMTVFENIRFGLKGIRKEQDLRVTHVLSLVRMEEYGARFPHELSGGQQQRVALARSIAPNPSLILLDEPFSNLDAHLQEEIRREIRYIVAAADMTTLFVTHDKADVHAIADTVIHLEGGTIDTWERVS
ncbi:ABC transporter ATP-binding protein [Chitinivibrio alkaliphilus]|uniref:ABC transporter, ATP-binding protein n=1 Tax=Chitinivibrio alkaliphilus ACht1 TaxID=1313304 RepID=U7DAC9_9BACT|nr:ABC transporter ATP-binding protein [Chitinivibrio alkaliphilus]ERP39354.1 ABC transporter, ATP-binding protein [Chitinivibrio alkaliphilus ACht1]